MKSRYYFFTNIFRQTTQLNYPLLYVFTILQSVLLPWFYLNSYLLCKESTSIRLDSHGSAKTDSVYYILLLSHEFKIILLFYPRATLLLFLSKIRQTVHTWSRSVYVCPVHVQWGDDINCPDFQTTNSSPVQWEMVGDGEFYRLWHLVINIYSLSLIKCLVYSYTSCYCTHSFSIVMKKVVWHNQKQSWKKLFDIIRNSHEKSCLTVS